MSADCVARERSLVTTFHIGILLCFALCIAGCEKPPAAKPPFVPATVVTPANSASNGASKPSSSENASSFRFRDATEEWKLEFNRYDDAHGQNRLLEANGGGVAVFDYDLDNRLDLFMTQGAKLPRKVKSPEFSNEMFRNSGHLERVTAETGLTSHAFHSGCTVGDVDEDGFPDLYVTAYGRSSLWHNNGDGTFADISELSKSVVDSWSTSAAFADFNGDGLLDLFVATYLIAEDDPPKLCKSADSPTGYIQCSPTQYPAADDVLLINDGQGGFLNTTVESGIVGRDGKGLGVLACDFDGDGVLEIFVTNDGTPCFLYKRSKESAVSSASGVTIPRYVECGAEFGVALNSEGQATAAMGIAHGDYDRDGWTDIYVTNFYLESNTLFRNYGGTGFVDLSAASRLGPPSRQTLAFGTEFLDVDHDGWLDLIVTTGHIEDRRWAGHEPYAMRPHLFRNDRNSKFSDVAETAGPYFLSQWVGRGLGIGDLDRDGDLDVVICHQTAPSAILVNESALAGQSVIVRPVGSRGSPRSGIGTRAVITGVNPTLVRDVGGGGSFQSASALELHFGMADRPELEEVQFTWSDGHVDRWSGMKPGYYVAIEGRGVYRISP